MSTVIRPYFIATRSMPFNRGIADRLQVPVTRMIVLIVFAFAPLMLFAVIVGAYGWCKDTQNH